MQGYKLKLADMDVKWDKTKEEDKPLLVRSMPRLKKYLEVLKRLTEGKLPPRRRLRAMRQAVA